MLLNLQHQKLHIGLGQTTWFPSLHHCSRCQKPLLVHFAYPALIKLLLALVKQAVVMQHLPAKMLPKKLKLFQQYFLAARHHNHI